MFRLRSQIYDPVTLKAKNCDRGHNHLKKSHQLVGLTTTKNPAVLGRILVE
jgi:hypothetical protein